MCKYADLREKPMSVRSVNEPSSSVVVLPYVFSLLLLSLEHNQLVLSGGVCTQQIAVPLVFFY